MPKAPFAGLSAEDVKERKRAGQSNVAVSSPSKSTWEIIRDNVFTYFNLVFFVIAVILVLVGSYRDLTFLPVILANTLTGIIQELRAKRVLDKINLLNAPKARVVRDGKTREVLTEDLVLGDVIKLGAGDQIPADARVLDGEAMVNEALLTGEADEIKKVRGDELMSGSFLVSGECYAKLERVGVDSYASQLTLQAKAIKGGEQSEILRSLNKIVKVIGFIIIPIGLIMVAEQVFWKGAGIQEAVRAAVAAVIGMIPEGLFLLATATLTISTVRLATNKVLVHDMKCIETLARTDVLCVDKTGTITENQISMKEVVELEPGAKEILGRFVTAQHKDNITMEALKKYFGKVKGAKAEQVVGFSSKYKYSAVVIGGQGYVLGAPELGDVKGYGEGGDRVLMFGRYDGELGGELTGKVEPIAVVLLTNKIRETAPATFRYFAEQGVAIKVISGDNPETVSAIAQQAQILHADKYVDASTLKTKSEIEAAVRRYTVFGRVTPEQKRKFVRALQKAGHTVAMTGDGVNDVLALKDADCGVAMASGSEAAAQAAQLVLLDSDFARMPQVVREGRRVVNNLERSGSLFLVKNIFSLVTATLSILFAVRYPLTPNQISLVTMWTIGVPSFFLAQMPNERLIKGKFINNIVRPALVGGIMDVVLVLMVVVIGHAVGLEPAQLGTYCAMVMAAVGMVYLYVIAQPLDWRKKVVLGGCLVGFVLCVLLMPTLWGLVW